VIVLIVGVLLWARFWFSDRIALYAVRLGRTPHVSITVLLIFGRGRVSR
jgi:hypothetical protein